MGVSSGSSERGGGGGLGVLPPPVRVQGNRSFVTSRGGGDSGSS